MSISDVLANRRQWTIAQGDCLDVLRGMPDGCVQTVCTSPPYFNLRDYSVEGQIGLESTPDAYVARLVEVFREVGRVLRDDGTLWLNISDSYVGGGGFYPDAPSNQPDAMAARSAPSIQGRIKGQKVNAGVSPKNLLLIPFRLALALQVDGWYVRSDICWAKKSPMPESVTDRPTSAWEHVFLLSKRAAYFYDAEAVREKAVSEAGTAGTWDGNRDFGLPGGQTWFARPNLGGSIDGSRNLWNYWLLSPEPFSAAKLGAYAPAAETDHFAAYPTEIPRRAILAGSRPGDVVLDPFSGSGTTGLVALQLGRRYVGIELRAEYKALSEARILNDSPLFNGVTA